MSQPPKNKNVRAATKNNELDPRDYIPVQYLCSLYSKDLLQGIFNEHVNESALTVFVNSMRRSNNGPLLRFGIEGARIRVNALMDCVKFCSTGEISTECKDVYTNVYAYLYTSTEKDPELRLFQLKRWLKERDIKVKAASPTGADSPMLNNSLKAGLQEFLDDRKLEAIVTLFEKLIRVARPKFTRVDKAQTPVEPEEPIQYDSLVVTEEPSAVDEPLLSEVLEVVE